MDVSECADIQEAASRLDLLGGPRGRLTGVKFGPVELGGTGIWVSLFRWFSTSAACWNHR